MKRKKKMVQYDEMGDIKKGPWKVEEDDVLVSHVEKYGPRDWSSIRCKGLLQRTGKSCHLCWVNKLNPNLKTGVKFSAEEERTVIEMQAQFGNKWAKISTYLPGRIDNDVKNFWSRRQKRLARILQTTTPSSSSSFSKPHNNTKEAQPLIALHFLASLHAPKLNSSTEKESTSISQFCPSLYMVHLPLLVHQYSAPQLNYTPLEKKPFTPPHLISFPQFPLLLPNFPLLVESHDFISRHGDPSFLDEFGHSCRSVLGIPRFLQHKKARQ